MFFAVDQSNGIHLVNLINENTIYGQAEGLLMAGNRNILSHVQVIGSGDAFQVNGPTYIVDSETIGTGPQPTTLARSPQNNVTTDPFVEAVLLNCTLSGIAPEGGIGISRGPLANPNTAVESLHKAGLDRLMPSC